MMQKNLLDLNDDVLVEICIDYTVADLNSIASTCTRLRIIAHRVFSLRHKSNRLDVFIDPFDIGINDFAAKRQELLSIFRNFGDLLTDLQVCFSRHHSDRSSFNTRVYNSMVMYCTGKINRLELNWCGTLQLDQIVDAAALFRNVKELTVLLYSSKGSESCFVSDTSQITKLNLRMFHSTEIVNYLSRDYPQLESLTLDTVFKLNLDLQEIKKVLKRHPNINELHLNRCPFPDLSLVDELPELRQLSISDASYDTLEPVARLDKLQQLSFAIDNEDEALIDFCNTSKSTQSLEDLSLKVYLFDRDRFLIGLTRFTNLKYLSIHSCECDYQRFDDSFLRYLHSLTKLRSLSIDGLLYYIRSNGLVDLVQQLPDLERLVLNNRAFHKWIYLKESTFEQIREIYQTRRQRLIIYNYRDNDNWHQHVKPEEPIVEGDQQESVQFMSDIDESDIRRMVYI